MTQLTTSDPIVATVIERRDDGSARIEVPVITVTPKLDLSKTEGGGKGSISISADDLARMVDNFAAWTKPVAVGFDGMGGHEDDRNGPQAVFVDALRIDGEALLAVMDLNAFAAMLVVGDGSGDRRERAYRGFSMEASRNPRTPTKGFSGWVLTGGVFTNNPATDTQFKIAATGETVADESITVSTTLTTNSASAETGDSEMSEKEKPAAEAVAATQKVEAPVSRADSVSLVYHEQEVGKVRDSLTASETTGNSLRANLAAAETRITTLEADASKHATSSITVEGEKAALTATVNRLELESKALRAARDQLTEKLNEQADELATIRTTSTAHEVKEIIHAAIAAKVPPAIFDGWEANPAEWLQAKYASLDAFKSVVAALSGAAPIPTGSTPKSGHDPKEAAADVELHLTDDQKAKLKKAGIRTDVDFLGVTSEDEARERFAASQKKD